MTNPPDVVAFIRARLAEREEAALHALGVNGAATARRHVEGRPPMSQYPLPRWRWQPEDGTVWRVEATADVVVIGKTWDREAGHITLNDPVAALQLCHALREVLQLAEGTAAAAANLADAAPGTREERQMHGAADAALRAAHRIARAWRDHPNYLPEWEMHL
jgi:hypothetical protein